MRRILIAVASFIALAAPCRADYFSRTYFTQSISSVAVSAFVSSQAVSQPLTHFALQVSGSTGTPTGWDVRLEGSLDGLKYSPLVQHTTGDGNGTIKFSTGTQFEPVYFFRTYVTSVTLGPSASQITVTTVGTQ